MNIGEEAEPAATVAGEEARDTGGPRLEAEARDTGGPRLEEERGIAVAAVSDKGGGIDEAMARTAAFLAASTRAGSAATSRWQRSETSSPPARPPTVQEGIHTSESVGHCR